MCVYAIIMLVNRVNKMHQFGYKPQHYKPQYLISEIFSDSFVSRDEIGKMINTCQGITIMCTINK